MQAKAILALVKGLDKDARTVTGVASTGSLDRDMEIIAPGAFDGSLETFQSNPVLMAAHTYKSSDARPTVIGSVRQIASAKNGLTFSAEFATTTLADEYWQLYRDGHMRAFSVGFIPKQKIARRDFSDEQKEMYGEAEAVHTEAELIEISAVAVPSNRDALVQASAKGLQVAEQLRRQLDDTRIATSGDLVEMRESICEQFARAVGDLKDAIHSALAEREEDKAGNEDAEAHAAERDASPDPAGQDAELRRAVGMLDRYLAL